jgi:hypothetical protein
MCNRNPIGAKLLRHDERAATPVLSAFSLCFQPSFQPFHQGRPISLSEEPAKVVMTCNSLKAVDEVDDNEDESMLVGER